jgi:hypothetical protein
MTFRYVPNNPAWLSPDKDLNTLTAAGRCAYKYWLQIKLATPKWYDLEKAKAIYKEAAERGLQVDHIVPLNSSIVCGLNCPDNFQLITELQNTSLTSEKKTASAAAFTVQRLPENGRIDAVV